MCHTNVFYVHLDANVTNHFVIEPVKPEKKQWSVFVFPQAMLIQPLHIGATLYGVELKYVAVKLVFLFAIIYKALCVVSFGLRPQPHVSFDKANRYGLRWNLQNMRSDIRR